MRHNEPSNKEILEAVHALSTSHAETREAVHALSTSHAETREAVHKLTVSHTEMRGAIHELTATNAEILETINEFATGVERRFNGQDRRFASLEHRIGTIETTMVTKEYLDAKLFDFRLDMHALVSQEDRKVNAFIDVTVERGLLPRPTGDHLRALGPFKA